MNPALGNENSSTIAVLVSGGLDSAVLTADLAGRGHEVAPVYVRHGLSWESLEFQYLKRFLAALDTPAIRPPTVLELPVADIYGPHWSVTGHDVPDETTPDEAVYLPGRNPMMLVKTAVWCDLNGISEIALATLAGNPFADNSESFYDAFETTIRLAIGRSIRISRPFGNMNKAQVIRLGKHFPLGLTFSCIRPVDGDPCGRCNKCAERQAAFAQTGIADPTTYASRDAG